MTPQRRMVWRTLIGTATATLLYFGNWHQIASGSSRLSGEKPNSLALTTCTQSASGG